jgi:hypothetical protein
VIRRAAALLLLVLLAGCSAIQFAYDNADTWLRWQAGRYVEFRDRQAEEFDSRLASFLAWHRARALPQYARLADEAGARLARGVSHADLLWGYDAFRAQSREGLRRAGAEIGDLLDRIAPGQVEQFERRFAEDNRSFAREHLEGTPEELRSRRLTRVVKTLEEWLGELDEAQRERVRQFSERAPLNGELREHERRRRQAEFVAMLRGRESARRLADWAADWERGRDPALAAGSRATTDEFFAMLLDLDRTLSARQRLSAIARLREFARGFDMLAAAR